MKIREGGHRIGGLTTAGRASRNSNERKDHIVRPLVGVVPAWSLGQRWVHSSLTQLRACKSIKADMGLGRLHRQLTVYLGRDTHHEFAAEMLG